MGSWGEQAFQFVQALGVRIATATAGDPRSAGFLHQRIAIAIQRGNAAVVLGTHRHLLPPKRGV